MHFYTQQISPTICNNSLVTAGSIYSENSKKYQALTGNKLTTIQSTELLTGMQTLSQTYHELVETCRSVLLVAKSVIVRDPIVKTVRMLEKSNNELDQKIEEISKQVKFILMRESLVCLFHELFVS